MTPFWSQNGPLEGFLGAHSASKRSKPGVKQPANVSLSTPNGLGSFLEKLNVGHFQTHFGTIQGLFGAVLGLFWGQITPLTGEIHVKPYHKAARTLPKRIPSQDTATKAPVVHVLGPSRGHLGPFWGHFAAKYHR